MPHLTPLRGQKVYMNMIIATLITCWFSASDILGPRIQPRLCSWTLLGDSCPSDPRFASPVSTFLKTPLTLALSLHLLYCAYAHLLWATSGEWKETIGRQVVARAALSHGARKPQTRVTGWCSFLSEKDSFQPPPGGPGNAFSDRLRSRPILSRGASRLFHTVAHSMQNLAVLGRRMHLVDALFLWSVQRWLR